MSNRIHLLDLIEEAKLEEILQAFTEAVGVASIITDVDGCPITKAYNFTSLCWRFCRSTEEGLSRCYESDKQGGQQSADKKQFVIYECFNAGLLDSACPIIIDDYHIANMLIGQVLEKPIERSVAIEKAKAIGVTDIDGYLEELQRVPLMDREKLTSIARLMELVTRTVSELALHKFLALKRSRRYLHKLVNSVSDCIIATDAMSVITMINDAGAILLGFEKDEILGRPINDLFLDALAIETFQNQIVLGGDESCRFSSTVLDCNSSKLPVHMALSVIRSEDEIEGFVAVIRDISEEKKMEKMKEDLVGMLTHDMSNPIISIQKVLQLLVDQGLGDLNLTQREMLRLAIGTGSQLYGIVNDFLDIYRSENGQFLLKKYRANMESLLMKGIEQVQIFAMEKKIGIQFFPCNNMPILRVDRTRLIRTCVNLLDNAVKYGTEGSDIQIHMKKIYLDNEDIPERIKNRLQRELCYCLVSITDNGPGIHKEHHREVFDKFFTIKSGEGFAGSRKGTGLGLAFCKLVVYAHDGYLWVKSPLSGNDGGRISGCCFSFVIPIGNEQILQPEPPPQRMWY